MFGNSGISLADIAAVTKGNNDDGFGGNNGWWVLIILFALFGGMGDFGNNRGNQSGSGNGNGTVFYPVNADIQRGFDTSAIVQKLDGINQGLCSLGYDQLAQMNGINQNITNVGFGIERQLNANNIANMQSFNALTAQIADCCCKTQSGVKDLQYTMATDTCAITTAINQAAQNIMQNDNANYRQLHDEIVGIQMQTMRDQLSQKDATITALNLSRSQEAQTRDIVNETISRLRDCPIGTYNVCNPFSNNCNNGCGG